MSRRAAGLAVALVALALAPTASAHGLYQLEQLSLGNIAIPAWATGGEYAPPKPLLDKLDALTRSGSDMKVAVVAQKADLVDVPVFLDEPQKYAEFLGGLLQSTRNYKGMLVVVTPSGVGVFPGRPSPDVARLRPQMKSEWDVAALIDTATTAVALVDRERRSGGHGLGVAWIVAVCVGVLAVVATTGIVVVLARRGRNGRSEVAA